MMAVLMGTYIHQVFEEKNPQTVPAVRAAVLEAGLKRVQSCNDDYRGNYYRTSSCTNLYR